MGLLYKPVGLTSFPYNFVEQFAKQHGYELFIETGTYTGSNACKAKQLFHKVYTIEASQILYDRTPADLKNISDLYFVFGDSREQLRSIC